MVTLRNSFKSNFLKNPTGKLVEMELRDGSIFLDPSSERASNLQDAVRRAHVDMRANSNPFSTSS